MVLAPASARTAFEEFQARRSPDIARQASALAKWAVECRLTGKKPSSPPIKLDRIFSQRAGVFVTINKNGNPRGCMGTVQPQQNDIAHEIIENAIGAATADLRRKPLALRELDEVTFCISIVGPIRPARSTSDLAPDLLGLLVTNGPSAGILLPGEAKTARWQIAECKRKAGLPPNAHVRMTVFRTITLEDKSTARLGGIRHGG